MSNYKEPNKLFFKDRTLYCATFPINEQAKKGEWNYQLKAVYCISILDFLFDEHKDDPEVIYTVQLKDQNNQVFYDKLTLIYLQLPNFYKKEHELTTPLDKWLFFIKNLEDLQHIPAIFKDSLIEQAFEKANLASFNRQEIDKYEQSLKVYRDLHNTLETAMKDGFYQGVEHGIEQGKHEQALLTATRLKHLHLSNDDIAQATGLSIETINQL